MEENYMKKKELTPGQALARQIMEQYKPTNVADMQNALKEIFGPMFEAMLNGEMDNHLGYQNNSKNKKETTNRRNGYGEKTVHTSFGDVEIKTPRDRDGSFNPQVIPKRTKDVSEIEAKVLAMYARGMSQRDISKTIEEIYGFSISAEQISNITDRILEELTEWRNRPLKTVYPFIFVDCMYVSIRGEYKSEQRAVYVILGYDINGNKEILGMWIGESESKHFWMQIFDEIKNRGVEHIFFISMDGVSGLEEGAKEIFADATVQRCIVHLIRNSIKYIPSKDFKAYTADIKKVYGAPSLSAANVAFEKFKDRWSQYPSAVEVWSRNYRHIEQLFDYTQAIRHVMYTTNAIESINSSFRKVTKKGSFNSENSVYKALYLRIKELEEKWEGGHLANWSKVLNELNSIEKFKMIILESLNENF